MSREPFIVKPSRPGSRVAEAYRLMAVAERREKRIHNAYRTKPVVVEPTQAPVKNAKPPRAKGGKQPKR